MHLKKAHPQLNLYYLDISKVKIWFLNRKIIAIQSPYGDLKIDFLDQLTQTALTFLNANSFKSTSQDEIDTAALKYISNFVTSSDFLLSKKRSTTTTENSNPGYFSQISKMTH